MEHVAESESPPVTPTPEADAKAAPESDLKPPVKRALVLSGGGAKGAYEAGLVITLMREFGEEFEIFSGTSIGAINASFLAQGKVSQLETVWNDIGKAEIVKFDGRVGAVHEIFVSVIGFLKAKWIMKIGPFFKSVVTAARNFRTVGPLETLLTITGALNPDGAKALLAKGLVLAQVKSVLLVSVTNVSGKVQQVFRQFPGEHAAALPHFIHEEPTSLAFNGAEFAETIRASGAIPAAFSPVMLSLPNPGTAYVDGGVTNNTPIGQAIDAGANEITIVYVDPVDMPSTAAPESLPEILASCFSMMQQCILDLDFKAAIRVNDAVGAKAEDVAKKSIVRIRTFRPDHPLPVGVIGFNDQIAVSEAYRIGQMDARNAAKRNLYVD